MEQEKKALINEVIRGKENAEQLMKQSYSKEVYGVLLDNILSSCGKAISMLQANPSIMDVMESTSFITNGSPRSEGSNYAHKGVCKRRKKMHCRTEIVKVSPGNNLKGTSDDVYSWRKYGQKSILGANYPREYFRCTNRVSHGCLATKLVQRFDKDTTILEVTYRGKHTCSQNNTISAMESTLQWPKNEELEQSNQEEDSSSKSRTTLKFSCEGLNTETQSLSNSPTFSVAFSGNKDAENSNAFTDFSADFAVESQSLGCISPSFRSPITLESTYFSSLSPCHLDSFELSQYIHNPNADIADMILDPASNFPTEDFNCLFDNSELYLWTS